MESRSSDSAPDHRSGGGSGRLMRTFWSVATTRHPVHSSTLSVWNTSTRARITRYDRVAKDAQEGDQRECLAYTGGGPKNRDLV